MWFTDKNLKRSAVTWLTIVFLILLGLGFFVAASGFNYFTQDKNFVKWLSPDESANYFLAKLYAQQSELTYLEKYNLVAEDIIHPRSLRSDLGIIKPMSFLGLPLIFGGLSRIFGVAFLPYWTPLFGALGLLFFYLLVKRWFGRPTGLIAATLLAVFPVYFYYSSRSMFHNILFIFFALASLYYGSIMTDEPAFSVAAATLKERLRIYATWLYSALSGLCLGLALITRASELLWLGPLFVLLLIINIKRVNWWRLILFFYFTLWPMSLMGQWNQVLYGAPLFGGYPEMNQSLVQLAVGSTGLAQAVVLTRWQMAKLMVVQLWQTLFHFGFHPRYSWEMFRRYVWAMFPWLVWLSGGGLALWLARINTWRKRHWAYILGWGLASLIVILYYGSWVFFDNPSQADFTIGNSYTRYWLPFYLGAIPLAAWAIVQISQLFRWRVLIFGVRCLAVAAIALVSLNFVLFGSDEGLVPAWQRQIATRDEFNRVMSLTEYNSVIITQYQDKLFFPERRVIVGLFDNEKVNQLYGQLAKRLPVYYYNFLFKPEDLLYLNQNKLAALGLHLALVKPVTDKFGLYQLKIVASVAHGK